MKANRMSNITVTKYRAAMPRKGVICLISYKNWLTG